MHHSSGCDLIRLKHVRACVCVSLSRGWLQVRTNTVCSIQVCTNGSLFQVSGRRDNPAEYQQLRKGERTIELSTFAESTPFLSSFRLEKKESACLLEVVF